MSKKIMLLALAVVSAAFFALPAVAGAEEFAVDGNTEFTGHAPEGFLRATNEPTITCETTHASGTIVNGSKTVTNLHLDFTGCHIVIAGFTLKCRTAGSALDNTITVKGVGHFIKNPRGVLVTPEKATLTCGSGLTERRIEVEGNVIGTITSPACNVEATSMTLKFGTTEEGKKQEHTSWTGKPFDLTAKTEGSSAVTAALETTATLTSPSDVKLTC